jgi:hypothetical protein
MLPNSMIAESQDIIDIMRAEIAELKTAYMNLEANLLLYEDFGAAHIEDEDDEMLNHEIGGDNNWERDQGVVGSLEEMEWWRNLKRKF